VKTTTVIQTEEIDLAQDGRADTLFEQHMVEVFGDRAGDFSESLRANLRGLWERGAVAGLRGVVQERGPEPPSRDDEMRQSEQMIQRLPEQEVRTDDERYPAVAKGMQPPGFPSGQRDTRVPMCGSCGGTGMGDYPFECNSCGGTGNAGT